MELHHVLGDGWSAPTNAGIACKPILSSSAVLMLAVPVTRFPLQTGAAMETGATSAALKDWKDTDEAYHPE